MELTTFPPDESVRPNCLGHTDVFFPQTVDANGVERENYSKETIERARDMCRFCPLFDACVEWGLAHYEDMPHGILFGLTPLERSHIHRGLVQFRDWRLDRRMVSRHQLAHLERQALKQGDKAVVEIYGIYEVEDREERQRRIEAYEEWCRKQVIPASYDLAVERAAHLTAMVTDPSNLSARQKAIPVQFRPHCPNNHGQENMARFGGNRRRGQVTVWTCYICKAKVEAEPRDLIPESIRTPA